ncbi:MAG: PAC2 family protein [Candidatus Omnitrophica bacterium]|nr:PAC2 family protein [Candidatus Omnitrophota bacterium]MDD5652598.1 PAC2 family protein [Candidatus Omnitrophota bacterium]
MEGIKITKRPRLKNPILVVAWPGMGEVSFKAASYLVEKLGALEFAYIPSEEFFYLTGSFIQDGLLSTPELPQSKFYYWKNPAAKRATTLKNQGGKSETNDLIIFISNAQPDLAKAEAYSSKIISLAKSFKVKTIVGFAAMPQAIDHTQPPAVWFTATSKPLIEHLKSFNFSLLKEGQISGMNGLFLGNAKKAGIDGLCLLADIPLYTIQIENPKASASVLEALGKILKLDIDVSDLFTQARSMEEEINRLLDYLKLGAPAAPIGEEEIEKIKRSLNQLTKLPLSIKDKIETLFNEAKNDIAKAHELKSMLDKWNVYKEYEDRFLDLFRKTKEEKSN